MKAIYEIERNVQAAHDVVLAARLARNEFPGMAWNSTDDFPSSERIIAHMEIPIAHDRRSEVLSSREKALVYFEQFLPLNYALYAVQALHEQGAIQRLAVGTLASFDAPKPNHDFCGEPISF